MPPTRHSRRVQGKSLDQILSSGRARKPSKSSLAVFNASRPLPTVSNRGTGRRKAKRPLGASTPIAPTLVLTPVPKQTPRGSAINLNSTPSQATSLVIARSTTTPSQKGKRQATIPPFNPTNS